MDIFQGWLWYAYKENPVHWHKLEIEQTNQIIAINKANKKVVSLEEYSMDLELETVEKSLFSDVVGQDSLTRFDKPKRKNKRRKNRNFRKDRSKNQKK
jgi:hypothetical protein